MSAVPMNLLSACITVKIQGEENNWALKQIFVPAEIIKSSWLVVGLQNCHNLSHFRNIP